MIPPMSAPSGDPGTIRRHGVIQRLLGGLNLRFPGLFALLAAVFVVDVLVPDFIPFVDEIILGILTLIFGLWKERRSARTTTTPGGPPLPPAAPPLPPPPAGR
jgi:hypothetical protein